MSWWPPATCWSGSGLDVGYWSEGCEAWFQSRLKQFESETPDANMLRSATRWRQSVKREGKTKKLAGNYEFKAALNRSWDVSFGAGGSPNGANISLAHGGGPLTLRYDHFTHVMTAG